MTRPDIIASHVETLLERLLQTDHVPLTADGAWQIGTDSSTICNVRVLGGRMPHVEVYSVAAEGVRITKALLSRLNELNAGASHARWFAVGDRVVVAGELVGETLDYEDFACTCEEVVSGAETFGSPSEATAAGTARAVATRVRTSAGRAEPIGPYL